MRKRTKARELALQILYELDIKKEPLEPFLDDYWKRSFRQQLVEKGVKDFTTQLVKGTIENLEEIDKLISSYAKNWQLKRMAVIDRNIIRMGCFELLFLKDIPLKVSINDAVELAKKYGDVESSKFVNGILDRVNKERVSTKEKQWKD
ncbi:MAG: transcription antitermination factor NusB [Candidatus Omnitrophota bacterium]|nr:MAG: transcription antitermination factor NusB [Candidatus Omnitrophota bacterium]